ncbi:MAG: DNA gyrase subunit A [Candidatus Thermoplasmatota archaeon]|nr:DNA gyrase subunit A [Candidatus Thermoplasmatota archaeon]
MEGETEEIADEVYTRDLEEEMEDSYINYAMSVIVGRALPDVRDGLKPVHRRILYSMRQEGLSSNKSHKKSARVVGDVLGKYHPHGDQAVYDALVRMSQDFSLRYPLVDGQGNFGSLDGDEPAAMRYTETRLEEMAEDLMEDLDKETVEFRDNYDGSLEEPVVMPSKLPNLLLNGASGIAVGMSTNVPPHNLNELVGAIKLLIDQPECEITDLMEELPAPDFPTGGIIYGYNGVYNAYKEGRGKIKIRAKTKIEDLRGQRKRIVLNEIPYQVNKSKLVESIASLVNDDVISEISDLRDESDRDGVRVVIDLKRGVIPDVVLNKLFKHTQMEVTFGVINLALVDDEPQVLNLKETLQHFIDHRVDVITRRTKYELDKAQDRAHILEGLLTALDNLDKVISIIRSSEEQSKAKDRLMSEFLLSDDQAQAILDMRLRRLTGMERDKLQTEYEELQEDIKEYKEILGDEDRILNIIENELDEMADKYGDERRTEINKEAEDLETEDLIPEEELVITLTQRGYIKRTPVETYKKQRRGGVGLIGMDTKEQDHVVDLFVTNSHDYLLFFTDKGRVYWLKAYKLPKGSRRSQGRPIVNMLPRLDDDENIEDLIPVSEFSEEEYLLFATKKGKIKRTSLADYSNPRVTGIWAIKLRDDDELVETRLSDGSKDVMLATKNGQAIRFDEEDVRSTGRYTMGVIGASLEDDDEVVSMTLVNDEDTLLTLTEKGYGKRCDVENYRKTNRGAKGVITMKTVERNGKVVCARRVEDDEEIVLLSRKGMIIRTRAGDISKQGRNTMGVKVMNLKEDDRLKAMSKVVSEEKEKEIIEEDTSSESLEQSSADESLEQSSADIEEEETSE